MTGKGSTKHQGDSPLALRNQKANGEGLSKPLVAIWMITYNHAGFIEQAVESVMNQKTTFAFHLFIGEDCSPDGTRLVCERLKQKYPERITLLTEPVNVGILQNALNVFEACKLSGARYIAMLEGDDYWTEPDKLQMQVDLLEQRKELTFCAAAARMVNEQGQIIQDLVSTNSKETFAIEDCIYPYNNVATCTVVYRNLPDFDYSFLKPYSPVGDWPLWIKLMLVHQGGYVIIPKVLSAYRVHAGGIYSNSSTIDKYKLNLRLLGLFERFFPSLHHPIKKAIGYNARMLGNHLQREGSRRALISVYLKYRKYPDFNLNIRDLLYKLRHRS